MARGAEVFEPQALDRRVALHARSAHDLVVLGVGANPEPGDTVFDSDAECAVMQSNTDGVVPANSLQSKRRMAGIGFQECERFVRECPDFCRKGAVTASEFRRSIVDQSFDDFPAACA